QPPITSLGQCSPRYTRVIAITNTHARATGQRQPNARTRNATGATCPLGNEYGGGDSRNGKSWIERESSCGGGACGTINLSAVSIATTAAISSGSHQRGRRARHQTIATASATTPVTSACPKIETIDARRSSQPARGVWTRSKSWRSNE